MRNAWIEAIRIASMSSTNMPVPTLEKLNKQVTPVEQSARSMTNQSTSISHRTRDPLRYRSCPVDLDETRQQKSVQSSKSISQSVVDNSKETDTNLIQTDTHLTAVTTSTASASVNHEVRHAVTSEQLETNILMHESVQGIAVSVVQRRKKKSHGSTARSPRTKTWSGTEFAAVKETPEEANDNHEELLTRRKAMNVCVELPESRHRSPSTKVRERSHSRSRPKSPPLLENKIQDEEADQKSRGRKRSKDNESSSHKINNKSKVDDLCKCFCKCTHTHPHTGKYTGIYT